MAQVLVIDDEPLLRTLVRNILERGGHTVLDASDGRAGLVLWHQNRVDVVLTDIFMPNKDGIEVLMEIKRAWPQANIIVMTGGGQTYQPDMVQAAILLGAARILQKPFDKNVLLTAIR